MLHHAVETCPDDHAVLQRRLDELTAGGARILTVLWQPRRADAADQQAAFEAAGSFLIVSESELSADAQIIRETVAKPQDMPI